MNESVRNRFDAAVQRAHDASRVLRSPRTALAIGYLGEVPSGARLGRFIDSTLRANALRNSAQEQMAALVPLLAVLGSWGARMTPRAAKPKVHIWAELNGRATLEIFWSTDALAGHNYLDVPRAALVVDGDCRERWPYASARRHEAFRALAPEYINEARDDWPPCTVTGRRPAAAHIVEDALTDSLAHLVAIFKAECNVSIGPWPRYTESGDLRLETVDERVCAILAKGRPAMVAQRDWLDEVISDKVRKLGLASVTEFQSLQAQAAGENKKVTALIFAKTCLRCSSLGTDKLAEYIADRLALEPELPAFDKALAAVADGRVPRD